jgi:hypothetical protein
MLAVNNADPKNPAQTFDQALEARRAALAAQLDQLFKDALKREPNPGEGANPDRHQEPETRRQRIARLLFNVYGSLEEARGAQPGPDNLEENPVYRRFLTVVGLRQAIEAVRDQARNLDALALEADTARGRDRSLFAAEHGRVLDQVRDRAALIESEVTLLVRTQQLVAAHEEQLKKRRRDVKQYQDELDEARAATLKNIASLREKSDNLFKKRIEVREKTEEIQKLEKDIRTLEDEVSPRR